VLRAKTFSGSVALSALLLAASAVQADLNHQVIGFQDVEWWSNTAYPGGTLTNFGDGVVPTEIYVGNGVGFHWAPHLLRPWGEFTDTNNVIVSDSRLEFIFSDAGFYHYVSRYTIFEGFWIYGVAPTTSNLGVTSVTINPETTVEGFGVSFDSNRIIVDFTGVAFTVDYTETYPDTGALVYPPKRIVLDVEFVPEPSSFTLLSLGAAALMISRQRK
jgi:hypothetical protein